MACLVSLSRRQALSQLGGLAGTTALLAWPGLGQAADAGGVSAQLSVDATDLQRRVLRVEQQISGLPAGPLTLRFARYLPGGHGPYGDVTRLAGLQLLAGDQRLAWRRDAADPFAFKLTLPEGGRPLRLRFDYLSPVRGSGERVTVSPALLGLQWEALLLYPEGWAAQAQRIQTRLRLPAGWQEASALRGPDGQRARADAQGWLQFGEVSLETLVDSPLFAGPTLRRVELDPPGSPRPVTLTVFADEPAALVASETQLDAHRALVRQADRLFGGARHFRRYDLMLALSDHFGGIGLEHHESSENGLRPDYFKDWDQAIRGRELLPHEFVHSWNGKYRRPADLLTPDYHQVMGTSMLWVYEGLTEYWGHVLAARAGLSTREQAVDRLGAVLGHLTQQAGRQWRPLQDTVLDPAIGPGHSREWPDWQRDSEYYDEGLLLWLEADLLIRERSGGQRSLDDFARRFHGGPTQQHADGSIRPRPYTEDELLATLQAVQPLDWPGFFGERLQRTGRVPTPLGHSGWRLVWRAEESAFQAKERGWEGESGTERPQHLGHSLGLRVVADGSITQVVWDSPAFEAGLTQGMKLLAVGGVAYTAERLEAAVRANTQGAAPIQLLVKDGERFRTVSLDWRGGLRYPALERVPATPDRLSEVYRPR